MSGDVGDSSIDLIVLAAPNPRTFRRSAAANGRLPRASLLFLAPSSQSLADAVIYSPKS